jgi:hypothetical protein
MTPVPRAWSLGALAGALLIAAALRIWGLDYGLPHTQGRPDEDVVVESAYQMFASGSFDPRFYGYPSVPFYAARLALSIYYHAGEIAGKYGQPFDFLFDIAVVSPGIHYRIARAMSVVVALATVWAAYGLGSVGYGERRIGLFAAYALATSYIHVLFSRFATVDVVMTLMVTAALVFAMKAAVSQRLLNYVLAGAFSGLAASSKYNAGLVALSIAVPAVLHTLGADTTKARVATTVKLFLAGVVSVATFALTSPYVFLHVEQVIATLEKLATILYSREDTPAWLVHSTTTLPIGLGWPLYLVSLAGLGRALWLRRPADVAVLAFVIPYFLLVGAARTVWPRYVLPLVPALIGLASEPFVSLMNPRRRAVTLTAAALLLLPGLVRSAAFNRVASREDTRVQAARWVAEHIPRRAKIAVCAGYGAPQINADRRRPPAFEPIELRCDLESILSSQATYVVTNTHPYHGRASFLSAEAQAWLENSAERVALFDPFRKGSNAEPHFFRHDIFYIPYSGLDAVERGGPIVVVWKLESSGTHYRR